MRFWLGLLAVAALVLSAEALRAQGVITPSSHWGGVMLPELRETTELGVHVVSFTRFGKELDPATGQYTFKPYNDIHETLGFNFLALSRTRPWRPRGEAGAGPTGTNALWRRETIVAGVVSDVVPVFLQNDVMHALARWMHWPGHERLRAVPRVEGDTPAHTSRGPTKGTPLLELSEEFFVTIGGPRRSPFFAGGGFAVGTIDQELFLHGGATTAKYEFGGHLGVAGVRLRSLGLGGIGRAGLLAPGYHFPDLTAHYVNLQGIVRAEIDWWDVPTYVEVALTSATGFFVAPRTPEQLAAIRERDDDPEDVYSAKTPVSERFMSVRVGIGEFTFETYNDVIGGKDKGPTFGAHAAFDVHRWWAARSRRAAHQDSPNR